MVIENESAPGSPGPKVVPADTRNVGLLLSQLYKTLGPISIEPKPQGSTADGGSKLSELANLPHDCPLNVKQLGGFLGRCKKSITRACKRGELPMPFKVCGQNRWLVGNILGHFQKMQDHICGLVAHKAPKPGAN